MGVWGGGLYAGDFAMDLRATIAAVVRLPFDPDRLVEILHETEAAAADDPHNEEHTTFWLIVADQFARRGIACDRVKDKALQIIDTSQDIRMLERLGMKPSGIRERTKLLRQVRERIVSAPVGKPRTILKKPQPLLMDVGDVVVYPTCAGKCINPYFASKETGSVAWTQDGWGVAVIIDRGRAFDFLSWYRPLTLAQARSEKPTLASVRGAVLWRFQSPGTCSPAHWKKMELEKIGTLAIDPEKVRGAFSQLRPGISAAVNDISMANHLSAAPQVSSWAIPAPGEPAQGRAPTILGIEGILTA